MSRNNIDSAQEVHHKFEFYSVALTFTLAGFAIQTGKFSGNVCGDISEIVSWIALSLSGVIGLSRLEYLPVIYRTHHHLQLKTEGIENFQATEEHIETIKLMKEQIAEGKPKLANMESANLKKYSWQKRLFVMGIFSLLVARFCIQMQERYW